MSSNLKSQTLWRVPQMYFSPNHAIKYIIQKKERIPRNYLFICQYIHKYNDCVDYTKLFNNHALKHVYIYCKERKIPEIICLYVPIIPSYLME